MKNRKEIIENFNYWLNYWNEQKFKMKELNFAVQEQFYLGKLLGLIQFGQDCGIIDSKRYDELLNQYLGL